MTDFLSAIYQEPHWVFLGLGCLLLIAELLGTAGYALWSGTSAIIVGLIAWGVPFSWAFLWILFAILTLASAYVWWLWLKKNNREKPQKVILNKPQHDLIGVKTLVVESIVNGTGRIKIKDGTWSAKCDEDLVAGTRVQVTDVEGIVLTVIKIN